jgi:hypothetical protein
LSLEEYQYPSLTLSINKITSIIFSAVIL